MNTTPMSCTTLDEHLADYLEDDLAARDRHAVEAHLASCLRCAALVRDIQQLRADAGALGELAPSRDLWAGIAERIEAPVVPLASAPSAARVARRAPWGARVRLAALAAGLVAVTAGVTYTITASRFRDPGMASASDPARFGGDTGARRDVAAVAPPRPDSGAAREPAGPGSTLAANAGEPSPSSEGPSGGAERAGREGAAGAAGAAPSTARNVSSAREEAPEMAYAREIERLREVFAEHKQRLDPRTAAILEVNLKVIDDAIAQSRAALAEDPASKFLNDRLNSALEKKVELLRTAARLPSRT